MTRSGARTGLRRKKAGLPPGTLIYVGDRRVDQVKIEIIDYDADHVTEVEPKTVEECLSFKESPTVTWLNVIGLHDTAVIEKLGERFGLHPLLLEDILSTEQRPKYEDFGTHIFIVLRMLRYKDEAHSIESEQVSLILGPNFVISFQEIKEDPFDPIRERIRSGKGRIRGAGADYLAYALMDAVVDNYFVILEKVGDAIEVLGEAAVSDPTSKTLHTIQVLKRELGHLRRSIWPIREVVSGLERGGSALIADSTGIYLRDVYDHTVQVMETVESFRDMVSGMFDTYLSSVSNRMNEVMKVLTIIATIFIPITFVAGVYGMNFRHMPELTLRWAYPAVLLLMLVVALSMVAYFRRRKWL
jgi:magnesium transporter